MGRGALIIALVAAALAPFAARRAPAEISADAFPGWPAEFEGRQLRPLPLAGREAGFVRGFPGRVGRFSDGANEIVVRWVVDPSRKLHPSADCFRGLGFTIAPADSRHDFIGRRWGAFLAVKGEQTLHVRELIVGADGRSWSDVSSWYWPAALGRTAGPWWVFTVAQSADVPVRRRL